MRIPGIGLLARINDLVAKYPELFEDGSIRSKLGVWKANGWREQPAHDNEQISLSEQPEQASLKATKRFYGARRIQSFSALKIRRLLKIRSWLNMVQVL